MLTAPLAGAYFLAFWGVGGACRKSPMKSRRKVYIIPFYQTQNARVRHAAVPQPDDCKRAAALIKLCLIKTSFRLFSQRDQKEEKPLT